MAEAPAGTVTFLFTDIEGSTRLLARLGRERYGELLAEHHRLLRKRFAQHGGHEVDTQGDAFFVVFRTAGDAVAAAVDMQMALAAHRWPDDAQPRVRMGLHTGEALIRDGRYVGVAVHRAQRLSATGHGGQVLLSNATREMVEDELPPGVRLRDLGLQRLKDLDRPAHLSQLEIEGLPSDFPPLRTEAPAAFGGARRGLAARLRLGTRRGRLIAAGAATLLLFAVAGVAVLLSGGSHMTGLTSADALASIQPHSGKVTRHIPLNAASTAVAVGEGGVWVLNSDEQTISRVDPKTGESEPFGTGATPTDIAVGAGSVWVGAGSTLPTAQSVSPITTSVTRVSPQTRTVQARIRLPRRAGAVSNLSEQHIAVGQNAVWTINPDFTISRINPKTSSVVRTISSFPAVAIAASGREVWALGPDGALGQIDPKTDRVGRRVQLRATAPARVAVGMGSVWVTDPAEGTLWRIDLAGASGPIAIPIGEGALGVAVGEGSVWVANPLRGTVAQVNPSANAVLRAVPVAGAPRAVAVGEGSVWVAVTSSGGTVAAATRGEEGLPRSFCENVFFGGTGSPDLLIASDLPLQGGVRLTSVQMSQAIAYVLRERAFRAGRFRVGYQSCDDSIARTGLYDEEKCAANAREYARHERVIGVVGTLNSPCALDEVSILNRAPGGGLAMVSPMNSTIGLTRPGPGVPPGVLADLYPTGRRNYVRVFPTDDYEAAALAQLARQLGARRVAVLHDGDRFFSLPLVESFEFAARKLGLRVLSVRRWDPHAGSYKGLARRIARGRPEAVYLSGILDNNGGQLVRDLRAVLGPRVELLGSSGFTPISLLFERAGHAAKGMYVGLLGVVPQRLGPGAGRFIDDFGATQPGTPIGQTAIYAAQAAAVLLDAIARSDGTRRSVIEELFKTRVEHGILGSFRFDRNGDTTLNQVTILRAERPGGGSMIGSFEGATIDRVLAPPQALVGG
jgi:branched-chain amino acid transport system substrate-binding protein